MINFATATSLQVKQEIDRLTSGLTEQQRHFAGMIARQLQGSPGFPDLATIRQHASTIPGGLPPQTMNLVVIAIIAILIGLLLPAVQRVRESAGRTHGTAMGDYQKALTSVQNLSQMLSSVMKAQSDTTKAIINNMR